MAYKAPVIDGLQFARLKSVLDGRVPDAALVRLADLGCKVEGGGLDYRVEGGRNGRGKLALQVEVRGRGGMNCQRCLEEVAVDLSGSSELELAQSEAEIEQADDDVDRVLAKSAMNVAELVEDEAILRLPMVPRHAHCSAAVEPDPEAVEVKKPSPFGVLAGLKTTH